jgi:hypothetical protein
MVEAMGIEDVRTAPRSPWQNAYTERLIWTVGRDCLDYRIVLGELHHRWPPTTGGPMTVR